MKNKLILAGVVAVVAGGFFVFMMKGGVERVSADQTVEGNYVLNKDTVFENGSSLTVNGNLTLDSDVSCDNGPVEINVTGNAVINGSIECDRREDAGQGIALVIGGSLTISGGAEIASDSNVQVVADAGSLVTDEAAAESLYNEAGENSGGGTRIGPFTSGAGAFVPSGNASLAVKGNMSAQDSPISFFIPSAHAQTPRDKDGNEVPNVVIGGTWRIGEGGAPPSGVDVPTPGKKIKKIILNFDFGSNGDVAFNDFHLVGPAGRDGTSSINQSCNATGGRGEDAFRMRVVARDIKINNFTLELGNGGAGGAAETTKDCEHGRARGGEGGEAGNFKMTAAGSIEIVSFKVTPGTGGSGGEATAYGKDGAPACGGEKGGDATATGGKGGPNRKELAIQGAVTGIGNVTIGEVIGGWGGDATAVPGKGGDGNACGCNGGKGGKGTATGGDGGNASVKIVGGAGTAKGGNGGDAESEGGAGGAGGSCGSDKKGGNGGNGGDAKSTFGKGGSGTTARGDDGEVENEEGGDGGSGGDGCGPGNGGAGGAGNPEGNDGADGKNLCTEPPKTGTQVSPPSGGTVTTPPVTTPPSAEKKVKVIQYQGKYLPVDQLIVEDEAGCGAEHWHAAEGVVKATDGSFVPDPGPQCGYGKVREKPTMEVNVAN